MSILGLDLGGTKLAIALFTGSGEVRYKESIPLEKRKGKEAGNLIAEQVKKVCQSEGPSLRSIGISVPGISRSKTGTVWAPNIEGWEDYPLLRQIKEVAGIVPVSIDNDRACCILGESWKGNAAGCKDAIYLTVGTGIGAGILVNGNILRGADDIAGAIGWMALERPYHDKYIPCGCFEYYASGDGIARLTREKLSGSTNYSGVLKKQAPEKITAHHVFAAYDDRDPIAEQVIGAFIGYWGMAAANLISIFNPEKIIFGGGVFGPAIKFITPIKEEAAKWAQPISMTQVSFEKSGLDGNAAIYGAGFLALKNQAQV